MLMMDIAAVFAFINVALVLMLVLMYLEIWRKFRSRIAVPLILFGCFFLVQNIVIIVFWYYLYMLVPSAQDFVLSAAPYLMVVNLTETIALANLVRVSMA
jgi:hypothetical protein